MLWGSFQQIYAHMSQLLHNHPPPPHEMDSTKVCSVFEFDDRNVCGGRVCRYRLLARSHNVVPYTSSADVQPKSSLIAERTPSSSSQSWPCSRAFSDAFSTSGAGRGAGRRWSYRWWYKIYKINKVKRICTVRKKISRWSRSPLSLWMSRTPPHPPPPSDYGRELCYKQILPN